MMPPDKCMHVEDGAPAFAAVVVSLAYLSTSTDPDEIPEPNPVRCCLACAECATAMVRAATKCGLVWP